MANGEIYEKNLSNASGIGSGDYLRTVNSNNESEKINYTLLAKAIIEQWTGSTLAGSSQSVKSAVDMLNNRSKLNQIYGTATITNADNAQLFTFYQAFTSASNVPEQGILFTYGENGNKFQVLFGQYAFYVRRYYQSWSSWTKMPTRAELDQLTNVFSGTTSFAALDPIHPNSSAQMGGVIDAKVVAVIDSFSAGTHLIHGSNGGPTFGIVLDKTSGNYYSGIIWTYHVDYKQCLWLFSSNNGTYRLRQVGGLR